LFGELSHFWQIRPDRGEQQVGAAHGRDDMEQHDARALNPGKLPGAIQRVVRCVGEIGGHKDVGRSPGMDGGPPWAPAVTHRRTLHRELWVDFHL
jgi:hypothetical protein